MGTGLDELTTRVRTRASLPPPAERRKLREAAGVSLADVARVVGCSPTSVFTWERGVYEPRGDNLTGYAEVLRMFRDEVWPQELQTTPEMREAGYPASTPPADAIVDAERSTGDGRR
jgi:transcriptional regulator with XRE-family HTH domain